MDKAHLDFETRSKTDLKKSGVHRYALDPTTRPWLFSYALSERGPVFRWRPGDPEPTALLEHIAAGGIVGAHNSGFERIIWNYIMLRWYPHWPELTIEQMDCTMARAAAISHPQSLDVLCRVLHTRNQKDMGGHALMMKMAKPRSYAADGTIIWWDEPENIERLGDYCDLDVLTEIDVDAKIPPLSDYERKVWHLDQRINDRGICVDVKAVEKCAVMVELAKKDADAEMRSLTGRAVPRCTNDKKLIEWIGSRGIECTTVKKGVQDDLLFMAGLANDETVRAAIRLRGEAKKTSTAKYEAMLDCVCPDGRIRGLLNYHGAGPGRWAGRLVQPQNFPRMDYDRGGKTFEWIAQLLSSKMPAAQVYETLTSVYGTAGDTSPLRLLSRFLRSVIVAGPGNKLVGGDFSNIEGRTNAWFAGEEWKLQAFRDYDTIIGYKDDGTEIRKGPDLYNLAYAKSFGVEVDTVKKAERQIGKVQELALGYQGGVGAFIDMGDTYGLDPYTVAGPVQKATSAQQWDAIAERYEHARDKNGLQEREWTALSVLVTNWRNANPGIVQSWWDLQDAAIDAVMNQGRAVAVLGGKVTYYCDGRCLWCVLPSGRMICYANPRVEQERTTYIDKYGQEKERVKRKVVFWGFKEGQWRELSLYGGLQCENIVQGTARCIMVDRMFAAEDAGFPLVLTVHDELLAEVSKLAEHYNDKTLEAIMSVTPPFVAGLPLAAKAWTDERYVK